MLKDYVVVDLEMTGLKAKTDRILEIGSVKVTDGMETAVFHCMVNPHMEIPPEITDLTGITNEMAAQGLEAAEAVREFAAFSRSLPLIGHNILFDYSFLEQAAVNHGIPFEKECLDTLKLARKYLPEAEKKTLDYLCGLLGIRQEEKHRVTGRADKGVYAASGLHQPRHFQKRQKALDDAARADEVQTRADGSDDGIQQFHKRIGLFR